MALPLGRLLPILLLVEDDADDQRFLQWAVRKSELSVRLRVVNDGEQAIQFLSQPPETLSLVLTDVHLPKKSGWDVLEWIRTQSLCMRIPVLMWTSLPNPEGERRAQQLGATSYFSKPQGPDGFRRLMSMIENYLRD
jgi:CheY-like chemotaxis protein